MSMKHTPGGCCCIVSGLYTWYENIDGTPDSNRKSFTWLDTWHQDPVVCNAALVSCESYDTDDNLRIPFLKEGVYVLDKTVVGRSRIIYRTYGNDWTYHFRDRVPTNPAGYVGGEMVNSPGNISAGAWTKGADADAQGDLLISTTSDPSSDIYVEQTASGTVAGNNFYALRLVVKPRDARNLYIQIDRVTVGGSDSFNVNLDDLGLTEVEIDEGIEIRFFGQNTSINPTTLKLHIRMVDEGSTTYTGALYDEIEIVSVELQEYDWSGNTKLDVIRVKLKEDYAHSDVDVAYPDDTIVLKSSFLYSPPHWVGDPCNGGTVDYYPPEEAIGTTEYAVANLAIDYQPGTEHHSGEHSAAGGIQSGYGVLPVAGVHSHQAGVGCGVGLDGFGIYYLHTDAGPLPPPLIYGAAPTDVVRHITPDVGGTLSLVGYSVGLFASEYPGWFGGAFTEHTFVADNSIYSGSVPPFGWEGYAYWVRNPNKHSRIISFADHDFPNCFAITPPDVIWVEPTTSPFYSDLSLYNPFPDKYLSAVQLSTYSLTQKVRFHYGPPTVANIDVQEDFTTEAGGEIVTHNLDVIVGPGQVLYEEEHSQDRLLEYDWAGEFPCAYTIEPTHAKGSFIPSPIAHCYGQIEWADGRNNNTIMIVSIAKLHIDIKDPDDGPDYSDPFYQPAHAENQYESSVWAAHHIMPHEEVDESLSDYRLRVIVNGVSVWDKRIFTFAEKNERAIGAYAAENGRVWFERLYTTDTGSSSPSGPLGWRMHIHPGNFTIDSEISASEPRVVGSSKHFIFVSGFKLLDDLTTNGYAESWAISYTGNRQIPIHAIVYGADVSDPGDWPIRTELALSQIVNKTDAIRDIDNFTFCPNSADYGTMSEQPTARKYPSRVEP